MVKVEPLYARTIEIEIKLVEFVKCTCLSTSFIPSFIMLLNIRKSFSLDYVSIPLREN